MTNTNSKLTNLLEAILNLLISKNVILVPEEFVLQF